MLAFQNHPTLPGLHASHIPVPEPGENEILVRILAAGVCHSDLTILASPDLTPAPITIGHEGCGEIVAFGPETHEGMGVGGTLGKGQDGLKVGDRVSLHCSPGCQRADCGECGRGLYTMCLNLGLHGMRIPGFYAEFAVVKRWGAVKVPEGMYSALLVSLHGRGRGPG